MITDMKPLQEQLSISSEGFGAFDNNYGADTTDDTRKTYQAANHNASGRILQSRRCLFKPLVGLFNQDKLLPIKHANAVVTKDDATNSKLWSIPDAQ
eukprot:13248794-Heterocapsa_arctica.AAC.1